MVIKLLYGIYWLQSCPKPNHPHLAPESSPLTKLAKSTKSLSLEYRYRHRLGREHQQSAKAWQMRFDATIKKPTRTIEVISREPPSLEWVQHYTYIGPKCLKTWRSFK